LKKETDTMTTILKSTAPAETPAAAVLKNWMPAHGLTPMQALDAMLLGYAEAVDELNRLRVNEQDATEALADAKTRVIREGVEGTNETARKAYIDEKVGAQLREAQRATSLRQMADELLSVTKERLAIEKIRARAIIVLLAETEG
jgi:hypothetical protein